MMYASETPPIPWRKEHDMSRYDKDPMYTSDAFKKERWAEDGFIDDFHAYTLGYETSNLIAFWTAVHGISSIIRRSASLNFGDGLFPNFFIIIVAPPAVVHKSTALGRFDSVERNMWDGMQNKLTQKLHRPEIVRGKATPEQLFEIMANKLVQSESEETYESDAVLILRISELSVFLSKAQYNQVLIDRLTDFYDCKEVDTDSTIARGNKELRNIFCSLFGCTTPDAFKNSIPETAFGGGFMSRCTIVQETYTHRIIPVPYYPKTAPSKDELAERLRWIFTYKRGLYTLTEEAYDAYRSWYHSDALAKRAKALEPNADHREGRKSDIILKLATILSAQRYSMKKEVTLEDFKRALNIIEYTNASSMSLIEDVAVDTQEDGRFLKFRRILKEHRGGISRVTLARVHHFKKEEIDKFLEELTQRDELVAKSVDNKRTYFFKEDKNV